MAKDDPTGILAALMAIAILASIVAHIPSQQHYSGGTSSIQSNEQTIIISRSIDNMQSLTSLDWGTLHPGDNANQDLYIINKETMPYNLSISTSNWNPSQAAEYMMFSWNSTGQILPSQFYICARLTLEVFPNCTEITDFSFMISMNFQEVT